MSVHYRIRRQQVLREVEGYLELITLFGDDWAPSITSRDRVANRALQVLDRLPDSSGQGQALYLRGQALRTLERYRDALEPLKQAAEFQPGEVPIWLALGWCQKRIGRLDLAIEALEEALSVDPSQAIIHYNLACYWSLAGNKRQALNYLSRAISMDAQFRTLLETERDFDPIRADPGFQSLVGVIV